MSNATPAVLRPDAAIVLVGTELVRGQRSDTNGEEVARALDIAGYTVVMREVLPDDEAVVADALRTLTERHALVVVTGGLGPTHDDVSRDAAARALGRPLNRNADLERTLHAVARHQRDSDAAAQVFRQADVIQGARVLLPGSGTAPGQLLATGRGHLLLLPGPPHELRPMLIEALGLLGRHETTAPKVLGCVGLPESDIQILVQRVLTAHPGVGFTVLARPGYVDVMLFAENTDPPALDRAASEVADALGDVCYASDGRSLEEVVFDLAASRGVRLAFAESCTGGMVAAVLTSVPGVSEVFVGGAVTYSNPLKVQLVGVGESTLEEHGAVSAETAVEMAEGARCRLGADMGLAVTGIAGPGGGTPDKPVGTVWFAIATDRGVAPAHRLFSGDRRIIRERATATALDLLRRELLSRPVTRA